jgi:hypothetical protein
LSRVNGATETSAIAKQCASKDVSCNQYPIEPDPRAGFIGAR